MNFSFSRSLVFSFSRLLAFTLTATLLITHASAQPVEIPDLNLKEAIREELQLPPDADITQQQMLLLTRLRAPKKNIVDLTGLEYATNLKLLALWGNRISDLMPLANLTELTYLSLASNRISDITPLARLTQLESLNLGWNPVQDISVLAKLINLKFLRLTGSPIIDYSPLDGLSLTTLERDVPCDFRHGTPIEIRLQNRTFPSIFSAWSYHLENRPELSEVEQWASHDLKWHTSYFSFASRVVQNRGEIVGNPEYALPFRDEILAFNPNMIFLLSIQFRDISVKDFPSHLYPEDFPYLLRDENGEPIKNRPGNTFLTDFTQPGMQDIVVQQVVEVAKCGLFDGIFLDWFTEHYSVLVGQGIDNPEGYYSLEIEQQAKDKILQRIRDAVPDDFLIIGNYNRGKIVRRAWGINGSFMEVGRDHDGGYTHKGLKRIENSLIWNEQNLKAPQVNCLEGWGITTEPPDSPNNKRWMRLFTTMSLTCSDGYVLYNKDNYHEHIWYDFWDANLGRPVGAKTQRYQNIESLYIREYTNGWAVYNRSGQPQTISLPEAATPVSDRGSNAPSTTHLLPDLDGEIYLTTKSFADVNSDGKVNVLDLVQVANSLGKSTPDPNGDGVVNILDLVFVTQQFSQ